MFKICFFLGRTYGFFFKMTFLKTAKDKEFVVRCNWIRKNYKNVEKVAASWEKKIGFSNKNWPFKKSAKDKKFVVGCNWNSTI